MDDVRAVDILQADEHLVQEKLDVLVSQELRRSDELVQVGINKLKDLGVKTLNTGAGGRKRRHTESVSASPSAGFLSEQKRAWGCLATILWVVKV